MPDRFRNLAASLEAPPSGGFPIVPDDAADLPTATRSLNAGAAGTVRVTTVDGSDATLTIAGGVRLPVRAILDRLRPRAAGRHADLITFVADRPGHDARYAIDARRIRDELGWRPTVTLDTGLARTVRWYLDHEAWWRPLLERDGVGRRLGIGG